MDNKYYTPTIEEFHIGFEYEWLNENNNWIKEDSPEEISKDGFEEQTYGLRVKYLDKEDIEELLLPLRFIEELNKYSSQTICKYMFGSIWDTGISISLYSDQELKITKYHFKGENDINNYSNLFKGIIKNKSEFKILLKQLGINDQL